MAGYSILCNRPLHYSLADNRSKEAFLELIQDWRGILVSDYYGTYKKWETHNKANAADAKSRAAD
jgi:hypothetical protein